MLRRFLILALVLHALHARAEEVLTNEQVITMTRASVASDTILALIASTSSCRFDTSADGIITLTKATVADAVIKAMVAKPCAQAVTAPAAAAATSDAFVESLSEKLFVRLRLRSPAGLEGFLRVDRTGLTFCCRGTVWNEQSSRGGCGDSFRLPLDQVKAQYLYVAERENPDWIVVTVADVRYRFSVAPASGAFRASYSDFVVRAFETLKALRPEMVSERLAAREFNKLLRLDPPSMEGHSFCDEDWNVTVQ